MLNVINKEDESETSITQGVSPFYIKGYTDAPLVSEPFLNVIYTSGCNFSQLI